MSRPLHALPFAAALALAGLTPAFAQGTTEQREACTPDAVKLCSDTIPDIPKTTACMERHRAELTPRCRAAMGSGSPPPARKAEAPEAAPSRPPRAHDVDRPSRHATREPRREDDERPHARRGGYGPPPDGPDEPDDRRAGRDEAPDRYGYGPRGGYGPRDEDGPDGPPPGYGPPDEDGRRADRDDGPPPAYIPPGERRYRYLAPNGAPAMSPEGGARARARAEIGRLCDDEMLDPRTCAETERALRR